MTKFNELQRALIVRDYLAGDPIKAIALHYGCAPAYVSKLMRRRGVKLRRNYYALHEGVPAMRS